MERLDPGDIRKNTAVYDFFFKCNEVFGWDSHAWEPGHKKENFVRMIAMIRKAGLNLNGASTIDVGCGFGDFYTYLKSAGAREYLGVDIHEPSLEKARRRYPGAQFANFDILEHEFGMPFDFAFASGSLSTRFKSDNYDFLESMVGKMWEITEQGVAFNFLFSRTGERESNIIFAYDPRRVLAMCKGLAPEARILWTLADPQFHVLMHRKS